MIASMTGFGRALVNAPFGKLILEIQSVNRKYLEISISLPKEYSRFELDIRKWVSEQISRGQIAIRLQLVPNVANMHSLFPALDQFKLFKQGWEQISHALGYDPATITLPFLIEQWTSQSVPEMAKEEDLEYFRQAVEQALRALQSMKHVEGAALSQDIEQRLIRMGQHLNAIELLAPEAVLRLKKKFQERILEVAPNLLDGEERILREVAIFAEKVDIAEEMTRFRSHIGQFQSLLKATSPSGRKMDFLVQEMGREMNTIGSKSLDAKIAHLVVEVKAELEKVREQIQNIE